MRPVPSWHGEDRLHTHGRKHADGLRYPQRDRQREQEDRRSDRQVLMPTAVAEVERDHQYGDGSREHRQHRQHAQVEREPASELFGHLMHVEVNAQLESFITTSEWYRGVPRRLHEEHGRPIIRFPVGGFWAGRTERLLAIHWPDPRLTLYHEDFIMGEAMRQNGVEPYPFDSGVRISDAPHRAPMDIPKELPFKAPNETSSNESGTFQ